MRAKLKQSRCWWACIALAFLLLDCFAKVYASESLSVAEAWQLEIFVRNTVSLPPEAILLFGQRAKSRFPDYDEVDVRYVAGGVTSNLTTLLIAKDGNTVASFKSYPIAPPQLQHLSVKDRPSRGGKRDAPVSIVVFDDLECPFCARLNGMLFPAVKKRYGTLVRIAYQDFPIDGHPWSLHASVDVNCMANNAAAYWEAIDQIHLNASQYGGSSHSLVEADAEIDSAVLAIGKENGMSSVALEKCVKEQNSTGVLEQKAFGDTLGIQATPTMFINEAKIEGAVSEEFLDSVINRALIAKGIQVPSVP